jgi:hypothetical protein
LSYKIFLNSFINRSNLYKAIIKRQSMTYSSIAVIQNAWRYVQTFVPVFCVHLMQFFSLYQTHKKFLSAHAITGFLHEKNVKNVKLCLKRHIDTSNVSVISAQESVRQNWNFGFRGFFICSFICDHKKIGQHFWYDSILLKCSM